MPEVSSFTFRPLYVSEKVPGYALDWSFDDPESWSDALLEKRIVRFPSWNRNLKLVTSVTELPSQILLCHIRGGGGRGSKVCDAALWQNLLVDNGAVRKPPRLFVCLSAVPPAVAAVASSV